MGIKNFFQNLGLLFSGAFHCRKVASMCYEYEEGQLSALEQKKFLQHLERCKACLRFIESYKAIHKLGSLIECSKMNAEQKEKILAAMKGSRS